jgi:putative ABC transport system permease protein
MSLLSGSYPAVFLSKFSPVDALKGKLRTGKQGKLLRNGLVTFQFFISMVLIVCTLVVFQQITFLSQKDIGFNRENLMVVNRVEWVNDNDTFLHALSTIPGVEHVSWCSSVPPNLYDGDQFKAQGAVEKITPLNYVKADEHYVSTLGLDLRIGRNLSNDIADKDRIILNETAVKAFGWLPDESVLGKRIDYPQRGTYEVIGIVRDFNYWPLQSPIQPMAIFHRESNVFSAGNKFMALRVKPENIEKLTTLIADVEKSWKKFAGDHPFQYDFVDQSFEQTVQTEKKFGKVLVVFASLAIMIACFGLLGMIIYTLEQRTKEIGIRKVVGATVGNIWVLVVKDYTLLIIMAIALSVPLCIWLLNNWLEDFNYRVELSPVSFFIAGGGILITSLLVTSYHVLKAVFKNPVDVLKDE